MTQQELQDLELVRGIEALLEEVAVRAGGEQAVASMLTHLLEDVACVRPRRGTSQSRDGAARSASPSPAQQPVQWTCHVCDKSFSDRRSLASHKRQNWQFCVFR